MNQELTGNLKRAAPWERLLYMLLYVVVYSVAEVVLTAVVVLQFGFVLFTSHPNARLLVLGAGITELVRRILLFLTFNDDHRPFPFAPWPEVHSDRTA